MSLAAEVLEACRARGWMLATAESCTGGLIAGALTEVPGSSDVVERGFVTYSNTAKIEMLSVLPATLEAHGAVSEAVAREMAEGALARSAAQIAVAVTGIAGPGGGTEAKPEGMVCFGLAVAERPTRTFTRRYGAVGRAEVRHRTVGTALEALLAAAKDHTTA